MKDDAAPCGARTMLGEDARKPLLSASWRHRPSPAPARGSICAIRRVHDDQAFLRISKKPGPVGAVPRILSDAAGHSRHTVFHTHCNTQAESVAGAMWLYVGNIVLNLWGELITGHQLDHLRTENLFAVQVTTVDQHLAEPQIVNHRPNCATTTAFKFDVLLRRHDLLRLIIERIEWECLGDTLALVWVDVKGSVDHPQWLPD